MSAGQGRAGDDGPRPGADAVPGCRPLAPTGALAVGDPPVAVREIARAIEGKEQAAEAAARAFPRLDEAERAAALEQLRIDPGAATPTPTWGQALSLVPIVGAAAVLLVVALAGAAWAVLVAASAMVLGDPHVDPAVFGSVGLLSVLAGAVGAGLSRFSRWALRAYVALGVLGLGLTAQTGSLAGGLLALGAAVVFLPAVARWFGPEGRAAGAAVVVRPYRVAVTAVGALAGMLVGVVPAFRDVFNSMGVVLPAQTQAWLELAGFLEAWSITLLLPLIALVGPLPLLRLEPQHERSAALAANLVFAVALVSVVGALALPIYTLLQSL